jgi:hypothetical protein
MNAYETWAEALYATCVPGTDIRLLLDGGHEVIGTVSDRGHGHLAVTDDDTDNYWLVDFDAIQAIRTE